MTVHYSLDSIVIRGRRLFGWGFFLHPSGALANCSLRVPLASGGFFTFDVLPGGYREDLAAAFPQMPHAGGTGFMVSILLPELPCHGDAMLLMTTASGEEIEYPLPRFPDAYLAGSDVALSRSWKRLFEVARQRGWASAIRSGFGVLAKRAVALAAPLRRRRKDAGQIAVSLDHGMGGGAARYRQDRVNSLLSAGFCVLVVRPELSTLSYVIERHRPDGGYSEMRMSEQSVVLDYIDQCEPVHVEVNNLVGFEDPLAILKWASVWRSAHTARHLRFHLHDFHAACPSFTLIASNRVHCALPPIEVCRRCLPANARHTLGLHNDVDIAHWRAAWARFLAAADGRIAFSQASVNLLTRALPTVVASQFDIQPHSTPVSSIRAVTPVLGSSVRIAAVGHISHAKGATLVRELARRSVDRGLPFEFVVVGTLEGANSDVSQISVTGTFHRDALSDMLERVGAGIAFVPSICPETYSYVTDELMATGLPLMVLALGAPAERVASYAQGCILPVEGVDEQLDTIIAFIARLKAAEPLS